MKILLVFKLMQILFLSILLLSIDCAQVYGYADSIEQKKEPIIPIIKGVYVNGSESSVGRLGNQIRIRLDHMDLPEQWVEKDLILYVNQRPYATIKAINQNSHQNELQFVLSEQLEEGQKGQLISHLYSLGQDEYDLHISVGTEDGFYADLEGGKKNNFKLILYNKWLLITGLIIIACVIVMFIYLSKTTRIIRDDSIIQINAPYSLARTQLAWWTLIIFSALVFIICITWDVNPLNSSVVVLLGISASTTAAGRLIDKKEQSNQDNTNKKPKRIQDTKSEGFFLDIMSDGVNGAVSIHRFQNVIFNLVLGLHFIYTVITTLEMPVYDGEILSFLGISSATYAGLKSYENKNNTSLKEV